MIRKEFVKAIRNNRYEVGENGLFLPAQKIWLGGVFTHNQKRHIAIQRALESGKQRLIDIAHKYVKAIGRFEKAAYLDLGLAADPNIVVDQGLNHILDVAFHNTTQVATWYVGIFKGNYTPQSTDTAANIASNSTEATEYDESTRQEWVEAAAASKSITNSANRATFTINATVTIYGAFLVSTSTKSGTSGSLAAASRFASQRDLVDDDELLVTYTLTAADA